MKSGRQSGYTMLEAIVYITISALLVVGVFKIMNNMIERYKISRMAMQVEEVHKAIVDRCGSYKNYEDCALKHGKNLSAGLIALLCNEKLAPKDMRCTSKVLFYRSAAIEFDTLVTTPGRHIPSGRNLAIMYNRLSMQECIELASHDFGNNQYFDLDSMQVDATVFKWPADIGEQDDRKTKKLPVSPSDAIKACVEKKNKNMVMWIFG